MFFYLNMNCNMIIFTTQLVLHTGSKHLLIHLGQSIFSHPLSGHLISHTGGSHVTSQLANFGLLH